MGAFVLFAHISAQEAAASVQICGSDLPSFRMTSSVQSRVPNSYWDRDGFCGHEVVGTVIASKSPKFKVGGASPLSIAAAPAAPPVTSSGADG